MSNPLKQAKVPIAEDLRAYYADAKRRCAGGPTSMEVRLIERCSRKEADNVDLKQQLYDEALAFNHANEIVGKLEVEVAQLKAERDRILTKYAKLFAEWLTEFKDSQPEEWEIFKLDNRILFDRLGDALLTARTQGGSNGK